MKTIIILFSALLQLSALHSPARPGPGNESPGNKLVLSGNIKDSLSGESLIGASVYVKELQTGNASNVYGFYSLSLKPGKYTITISYVGYITQEKQINLTENIALNIELSQQKTTLNEVVIKGEKRNEAVTNNEMSVVKMKPEQIKAIPALMGEVDVIKAIQLLPGVQSSGEGFSGYNVRGGGSEQNLILLDEAPIYNASHLMGFFSVFNFDAIKDVKLYKGDIPVAHGGRLSSLLDIRQKEGNAKSFSGSAGIGSISSRIMLEGPIVKNKSSFMIAARRSYADIFLPLSSDPEIRKNKLYFYDLNLKLNYTLNDNDRLYFSAYTGKDVYDFDRDFGMSWGNNTQTLRWNHLFSRKLFSNITMIRSQYKYEMALSEDIAGFKWLSGMNDLGLKADFGFYVNPQNTIRFGITSTHHTFQPGRIVPNGNPSVIEVKMPENKALEHAIYLGNEQELMPLLTVEYGIRYSVFQNMGAGTIYNFDENFEAVDSTVYSSGNIFNTQGGAEPRIGMKYILSENSSLKASYSRTMQYVHLASNSQGGTPLDIWFPSNKNVKPQIADQIAIGFFKTLHRDMIEGSVEVYYKNLQNQIDFRDNAQLLMNARLDGELRYGEGRAYGIEFLLRKQEGRLNGWVSYTLSKSERKIEGINDNEYYPANCDKPHNLAIVLNYSINERVSVSANWVYSSGAPVTMPTGKFEYGNINVPVYSGRNGYRLPDYHRLDLSLTLKGKERPNARWRGEWNFSLYNAYYRKNAFSITFAPDKDNPSKMVASKVYLFPVIPAVTYNVKF